MKIAKITSTSLTLPGLGVVALPLVLASTGGAVAGPAAYATAESGQAEQIAACVAHSSNGLAKDLNVKVTKVRRVSTKRVRVMQTTVKVRVRLAVTAIGTATGYATADACPAGVSNPKDIAQTFTWKGTRTTTAEYSAWARTIKQATRKAAHAAANLARDAAVEEASAATVRNAESTARKLAWAASDNTTSPPPRTLTRHRATPEGSKSR
jgi:hypothetical protein